MTNELLTCPVTAATAEEVVRIHADHDTVRRLGAWTDASRFEVRARNASVVLDLRAARLPKEIEIELRLDRARVKLLLPDETLVEHWDLDWNGRGQVKDGLRPQAQPAPEESAAPTTQSGPIRVRLHGAAQQSEVRVHRGGMAQLTAICSREFFEDARRAHKSGTFPTVDDPTRTAMPTK
jgi:hypothetical protein